MTQPRKNKSFKEITELPFQTVGEEIANSILHGIGVLLAVAGLVLLTLRANGYIGGRGGGALAVTSYVIFAVTMICMFLASTLYHAIQHKGAKRVFRVLDHSAIYLLIAGTYTPFCLTALPGAWGWSLFGVEWGLAAAGITLYAVNYKPLKKIEVAVYILMGWAIVIGWIPLYRAIPRISLILLLAGGLAYTLGTIWYRKKDTRGAHVTWHVFVLIGAVCHWWSIWFMS
ncbi:hemolysin III family protein [Breznakiella homolactica]|uniref:Hemolysin III family protein n=2 Tax=Breznakiella homolactica TaxID=2798577 RepID=A0A7T7XRX0_9SPIR|nr:hemolysin III family protein [Breznakiella homolactica]